MTQARRLVAGQTYLVTRRCARRCFFLKPTRRAVQIMTYGLAHAASQHAVQIHAVHASTTHYHLVLTDPTGELPRFMERLNGLLARSMNVHLGRGESFWAPGSYSAVELHGAETVLAKLVYTITNPTRDGLVRRPEQWPGLHTLARHVGARTIGAERPVKFFRKEGRGCLPERASFRLTVPCGFEGLGEAGFRSLLARKVDEELEGIYAKRRREGKKRFLGVMAIMAQSPFEAAGDCFPRRELNPRIACKDPEQRVQLLKGLWGWRKRYGEAWQRWRRGDRAAVFPAGSWWFPVFCQACVHSGPAPPRAA